jgi:hypothetical protein
MHDPSNESLKEELEEEAVEIDFGVVDLIKNPDIQCKVCWDNSSTNENPLTLANAMAQLDIFIMNA